MSPKKTLPIVACAAALTLFASVPTAHADPEGNYTYARTDGPIVLVAGLMAFDQVFDVDGVAAKMLPPRTSPFFQRRLSSAPR